MSGLLVFYVAQCAFFTGKDWLSLLACFAASKYYSTNYRRQVSAIINGVAIRFTSLLIVVRLLSIAMSTHTRANKSMCYREAAVGEVINGRAEANDVARHNTAWRGDPEEVQILLSQ